MVRLRIYDEPMTDVQRRQKSDADRKARGEYRLNQWISAETKAALDSLVGPNPERGAIAEAVSVALTQLAERNAALKKRKK
jgi:hypothetical protein